MTLLLSLTQSAAAQEAPPIDDLAARLEALEQAHRILERKLELEKEKAAEDAKSVPVVSVGEKGFSLKSPGNAFQLRIRGLLQIDGRAFPDDGALPLTDTFLIRRARPILEASFFDLIDVKLNPDFGGGTVVLFDAYAEIRPWSWLRLRAGKFKPAVGLERLQSASNLEFVERAAPTSLVPNRDLGLQLSGDAFNGAIGYAVGVFDGTADNAQGDGDNNENKEVLARLFVHPFRFTPLTFLENFGLGLAGTYGRQTGTLTSQQLATYKSPGQQTFFTWATDAIANGNRTRIAPQGYLYVGPVGVLAEYVSSSQPVTRGANTRTLNQTAWQTQLSWVITGEKASYDGVTPAHPFSFSDGHPGAFEVSARYHVLKVDDSAFPLFAEITKSARRATSFGLGFNWVLNRNGKVNLDYERTEYVGGALGGNRPSENAVMGRLQVSF